MSDYMSDVKCKTGYESLKSQHMKKYLVLGQKTDDIVLTPLDDHNDCGDDTDDAFEAGELANLREKLTSMEKEHEDNRKCLEQRLHQTKRNSDLARNKINTATECLDMYHQS